MVKAGAEKPLCGAKLPHPNALVGKEAPCTACLEKAKSDPLLE